MTEVKITRLTEMNVSALRETLTAEDLEFVTLGATVATFHTTPEEALRVVGDAQTRAGAERGTRGHPYQSLHAVIRKLTTAQDG